ncbi:hypothetical protein Hanom_Chr10g00880771 [Helianthus anomalus]
MCRCTLRIKLRNHFLMLFMIVRKERMGVRSLKPGEQPWVNQFVGNFMLPRTEALMEPLPLGEGVWTPNPRPC